MNSNNNNNNMNYNEHPTSDVVLGWKVKGQGYG